jgi:hypothetical protein
MTCIALTPSPSPVDTVEGRQTLESANLIEIRGLSLKSSANSDKNLCKILLYFISCHTNKAHTKSLNELLTLLICLSLSIMNRTINLYDKLCRWTKKVNDITANWVLAPKLITKGSVSQCIP